MIKITFPDGSVREYNEGVTGLQIAESISSRLAQDVLACGVNGEIYDLGRPINEDAEVVLYKWEDEQGKQTCPPSKRKWPSWLPEKRRLSERASQRQTL